MFTLLYSMGQSIMDFGDSLRSFMQISVSDIFPDWVYPALRVVEPYNADKIWTMPFWALLMGSAITVLLIVIIAKWAIQFFR